MPESLTHMDLVRRTHRYIVERFPPKDGFVVYLDAPETTRANKPPKIHDFCPDVFAADVPTTFHVIGEAKTEADLLTAHTRAQLLAFCRHLKARTGVLILTVPWIATATARRLVAASILATGAVDIETVVLDEGDLCP